MAKFFVPLIKRMFHTNFKAGFGKLNFWRKIYSHGPNKNGENFVLSQNVLRKYFLAKFFVPLIKRSVSTNFKAVFGKLNFWQKIHSPWPYKNGENFVLSQNVLRKYFLATLFVPLIKRTFSTNFRQFSENWIFDGKSTAADLTKMVKNLNYLKLCYENIAWQNYLFNSSKKVFLHNFRHFLENWIFEGISTGADLTKMVKIWTILNCAKKIFFVKIICSTHQRKCFSTILGIFWKIEILKEYRQARTLQKCWKFELS